VLVCGEVAAWRFKCMHVTQRNHRSMPKGSSNTFKKPCLLQDRVVVVALSLTADYTTPFRCSPGSPSGILLR